MPAGDCQLMPMRSRRAASRYGPRGAAPGFTLIELMVAVTIFAVLAAIAIASYSDYVTRARRAEGKQALTDTLQQMERYYAANNSFIAFSSSSAIVNGFRTYSGDNAKAANYVLSAAACPGSTANLCVVISAVPSGSVVPPQGSKFVDSKCGTLMLWTSGSRTATKPDCW